MEKLVCAKNHRPVRYIFHAFSLQLSDRGVDAKYRLTQYFVPHSW